jgi:hypothetical protein
MRRSIAVVAAIVTVSLGLIAAAPAEAGGGHGHKPDFKRGTGHGYGHGYGHCYRHSYVYKRPPAYRPHRRGFSEGTLLTAVGIVAGAKVAAAYLQGPPVHQTTVVYAAPVQPRPCYQVMVPYAHPYGGYYYVPQVQCY